MELHQIMAQMKRFLDDMKNGANGDGRLDLTLRLGLPYYDMTNKEHQAEENRATRNEQVMNADDASPAMNLSWLANSSWQCISDRNVPLNHLPRRPVAANAPHFEEPMVQIQAESGENDENEWRCQLCNITDSPLRRRGPGGPQTLCNACGLRYSRTMKNKTPRMLPFGIRRDDSFL